MHNSILVGIAISLLGACSQIEAYGTLAAEQRRQMNDMQARLTMAATCDISIGAFYREMSSLERQYAGLVCGGISPEFAGKTANLPME